MIKQPNRTFICSVVFIDIVDYSTKMVEEQIKLKGRLNEYIAEAIKNVAVNDRLILDTGDGASIGFLGDPEDALFCSLTLRDSINANVGGDATLAALSVRIGINLGPVKLVKDINGRPNLIGDGINIAQRVMSFADPGQILVSRSYFDIVGNLSQEYAQLFHYLGMRADKHVREHEIYSVEKPAPVTVSMAESLEDKGIVSVAETKGAEVKPGEAKPADAKTADAKPIEVKPGEKKPVIPPKPAKEVKLGQGKKSSKMLIYAVGALVLIAAVVVAVFVLKPKNAGSSESDLAGTIGDVTTTPETEKKPEKQEAAGQKAVVPLTPAQQYLQEGIQLYEKKEYAKAEKKLEAAKGSGFTDMADMMKVNKYLAFVYCQTGKTAQGQEEFKKLLSFNPKFTLSAAEAANSLYGPAFQKAKTAAGIK
jgi:class 3 adenylate cyclase/uncharacterized low-complexity protein